MEDTLRPNNPMNADKFGYSVDVDGDYIAVGAYADEWGMEGYDYSGAAYIFHRSGSAWTQQQVLYELNPCEGAEFGKSVCLDGSDLAVGAPYGRFTPDKGYMYIFTRSGSSWTQQAKLTGSDSVNGDQFGGSVAIHNGTAAAGSPGGCRWSNRFRAQYIFSHAVVPPGRNRTN